MFHHIRLWALPFAVAGCAATTDPVDVPDYASTAIVTMALANVASDECAGMRISKQKEEAYENRMVERMRKDGRSDAEIIRILQTISGNSATHIRPKMNQFAARHGISMDDRAAFCPAIRKERKANPALNSLFVR